MNLVRLFLFITFVLYFVIVDSVKTYVTQSNLTTTTPLEATNTLFTTETMEAELSCNSSDTLCLDYATLEPPDNTTKDILTVPTTDESPVSTPYPSVFKSELYHISVGSACSCNLQFEVCDINCCCDKDCNYEEKLVFDHCENEIDRYYDSRFCKYMKYIYKNNTPYEWEVNQNGLFCIVKSNLPPQYVVEQKQILRSIEDAQFQKQNKYDWGNFNPSIKPVNFDWKRRLIFGMSVWILKSGMLQELNLPNSFISNACLTQESVKFLKGFKSKCIQQIIDEDNSYLNAEFYYKNISVVSSPNILNLTSVPINQTFRCTKNLCIPIEVKTCDEDFQKCTNISKNATKIACYFNTRENINECSFLVYKLKYNIYHNGTDGIKRVELLLVLKNVSYSFVNRGFQVLQEFEVAFFWFNSTLNYSSLLSGNPGYQMGKLILIGNFVTTVNISRVPGTNLTKTETKHEIQRNGVKITDSFLIFPENVNGYCVLNNNHYTPVEFGYNLILKCKMHKTFALETNNISISSQCRKVQNAIFDYWSIYVNSNVSKVIGSFGNSNSTILNDWEHVIFNKVPKKSLNHTSGYFGFKNKTIVCLNITNTLSINIFYSRIDTKFYQNQNKIIGATFNFNAGSTNEFPLDGTNITFELDIHMNVVFFDITKPTIRKFVDPPTFKIQLPYDFFYPFVKLDSGCKGLHIRPTLISTLLILSYILY